MSGIDPSQHKRGKELVRRLVSAVTDGRNRKSQKNPKIGRISKNKPQQVCKLINIYLQTENEGRLGFRLWPPFARFSCALALKSYFSYSYNAVEIPLKGHLF